MKIKEEILKSNTAVEYDWDIKQDVVSTTAKNVYDAMDDYAKHVALNFIKWNDGRHGYTRMMNGLWASFSAENKTDDDVFNQFKSEFPL